MNWLRRLLGRPQLERELDAELRDHFERLVSDALRRGLSPADARRAAGLEFGGVDQVKEDCREARRTQWVHNCLQDARFAVRRLLRHRGASVTAVATLACAIGSGTVTWSLLSSLVLQPLPVKAPDRLFVVGTGVDRPRAIGTLMYDQLYPLIDYVRGAHAFDRLAAGGLWSMLVGEDGASGRQRNVYFATANFFDVLGVRPVLGRGFAPDDDRRGAPLVAILSNRYWRLVYGGDPRVLGRTITVSRMPARVIGIAPPRFRGLSLANAPDIYLPLETVAQVGDGMTNFFAESIPPARSSPSAWLTIVGRLREGSSPAQVEAKLNALAPLPHWRGKPSFGLTDVNSAALPQALRGDVRRFTGLLASTVGLLLLSGVLSVSMLLLLRTEARQDELAMCVALGATRLRLLSGVAMEGVVLAAAGALGAIPIAIWLFAAAGAFQLPGRINIELLELSLDVRAWVGLTAGASAAVLAVALAAGTFGFAANRTDGLRLRAVGSTRLTRRRTRAVLVVAQVAVALVLLTGAGLFARSLAAALALNPSVDIHHIVTGGLFLRPYGYTPAAEDTFFEALQTRLSRVPSIRSLSVTAPQGGMTPSGLIPVDGVPRRFPSMVSFIAVDEHYFTTMGLPIVRGRTFSSDDTPNSPLVVVVSESFGRLVADGGDPIGHRITETHSKLGEPPAVVKVIGVVPDVITDVNVLQPLEMYYSIVQEPPIALRSVVLRAADDPQDATRETVNAVRQIDPRIVPQPFQTIDERIWRQMSPQRLAASVLGGLGAIAALLTLLGTYVLAETMSVVRRREMGIRSALGASRRQLRSIVVGETLKLVGLGLALGLGLAVFGADSVRAFLFRIQPLDLVTLGGVAVALLGLAVFVSLRPAIRASRVDLASILRDE